jgi:hypothetical protein
MSDPIGMADEEEDDILDGGEGGSEPLAPSPMAPRVSGGGRPDAILQLLAQATRTGSQGEPRPSYAADIAGAQNRIAKILASGLKGLEETSGLERVGQAAMQTLAGQGRISFPQAEAAAQQQDLSRAYNIANALSGLAKSQGGGQLNQSQMLNLLMRGQEGDRRERANFARNTDAIARAASANLENPAEGMAYIAQRMQELGANSETPLDKLTQIRTQAIGEMSRQRFRTKKEGRKGEGGDETPDIGGPTAGADGSLDLKPYKKVKGAEWAPWMVTYNQALNTGDKAGAEAIFRANVRAKSVLSTEERKPFDEFLKTHQAAVASGSLIGNILKIANENPAALAQVGSIQSFIANAASQVGNLLASVASDQTLTEDTRSRANRALSALTGNPDTNYKAELDTITDKWKNSPLFRNAVDAAQLRSMFTTLAYSMAAANDPGGRFTNQDIKDAMGQIAATNGDLNQLRAVLNGKYNLLSQKMEVRRQQTPYFNQLETPWSPTMDVGAFARIIRGEVPISGLGIPRQARTAPQAPSYSPGAPPAAAPGPQPATPNLNDLLNRYAPR